MFSQHCSLVEELHMGGMVRCPQTLRHIVYDGDVSRSVHLGVWVLLFIHLFSITFIPCRSCVTWRQPQLPLGERWGSSGTGRQSIMGITQRDRQ